VLWLRIFPHSAILPERAPGWADAQGEAPAGPGGQVFSGREVGGQTVDRSVTMMAVTITLRPSRQKDMNPIASKVASPSTPYLWRTSATVPRRNQADRRISCCRMAPSCVPMTPWHEMLQIIKLGSDRLSQLTEYLGLEIYRSPPICYTERGLLRSPLYTSVLPSNSVYLPIYGLVIAHIS